MKKKWKQVEPGNAVMAFEKGDWGVSLTRPNQYNPNAEIRMVNFRSGERVTVPGSPSILLKKKKTEILGMAERHIKNR